MDFHHPLVRSVLLPCLLALAATGGLRWALGAEAGRRWAAAGVGIAIVAAMGAVTGWPSHPGSLTEKLPWLVAAAGLLGLLLQALRAGGAAQWLAASGFWALAIVVLGAASPLAGLLEWAAGALVIAAVLQARADSADAPALLAVAGLGLAAVAMRAASLLLFELALGGAVAVAAGALWLWPRARIGFGAAGRITAVLAWLALAHATARLTQASVPSLGLLVLVFALGPLLSVWPRAGRPSWAGPLWRAGLAAVLAAGALVAASRSGDMQPGSADEYPYYTPRW